MTLDYVVKIWDKKEHSFEEKLDHLETAIFKHVGLKRKSAYYFKKGKFFERYAAGFIHTYIFLLKDLSYIVLDPIHVFNILTTFVKNLVRHPIKSLKNIWGCWSFYYSAGPYGLGVLTANALLAATIAGAVAGVAEGSVAVAAESSVQTFGSRVAGATTGLPRKLASVGRGTVEAVANLDEAFATVMRQPQVVLADAATSVRTQASFGTIRTYKFYTGDALSHDADVEGLSDGGFTDAADS